MRYHSRWHPARDSPTPAAHLHSLGSWGETESELGVLSCVLYVLEYRSAQCAHTTQPRYVSYLWKKCIFL